MAIRWGIAGPGAIAEGFAQGLALLPDGVLTAVGSRSLDRAQAFADRHGASAAYGSYEALAEDPDVDVVYVATPHSRHARDTLQFLEAGKHVLCEKPFALSEAQGREMAAAARRRGLFLMEAMWTRFLPAYRTLTDVLGDGRIGDPLLVEGDFGFRRDIEPTHRLFDLALGGGALLDLGVYPIQLASLVLGPPDRIAADGHLGATGVDEVVAAVLHHEGGGLAVVKAGIRVTMTMTARIAGTDGSVQIPALMHCPDRIEVTTANGTEVIDGSYEGSGLRFQAEEVHRCLADGRLESAIMPLDETLSIARTMDTIRAAIGLAYPGE